MRALLVKEKAQREQAEQIKQQRQQTNQIPKGFSIPRHKPISEVSSIANEEGNGGSTESGAPSEPSNKPSTSPSGASTASVSQNAAAPAPALKRDTPTAESGSKALAKPSPVSKTMQSGGSSQASSQVYDAERERQKEMERRKRQAIANQIDMNAASEMLHSFESNFDESFH